MYSIFNCQKLKMYNQNGPRNISPVLLSLSNAGLIIMALRCFSDYWWLSCQNIYQPLQNLLTTSKSYETIS